MLPIYHFVSQFKKFQLQNLQGSCVEKKRRKLPTSHQRLDSALVAMQFLHADDATSVALPPPSFLLWAIVETLQVQELASSLSLLTLDRSTILLS